MAARTKLAPGLMPKQMQTPRVTVAGKLVLPTRGNGATGNGAPTAQASTFSFRAGRIREVRLAPRTR